MGGGIYMNNFEFDDMLPDIDVNREEAIDALLGALTLEQLALSQIINIISKDLKQSINNFDKSHNTDEILKINKSIQATLRVINNEVMLLENKTLYTTQLIEKLSSNPEEGSAGN
jgi:hypothetical protein